MAAPLLSIIIPVYNEARTLRELLRRVLASPIEKEILIVDDGSTDGSADILKHWLTTLPKEDSALRVRLLTEPTNRGKGYAIRRASQEARGQFTLIQDADLEYNPQEYPALLKPLLDGDADVVYGSRFSGGTRRVDFYRHAVANKALTTLSNFCTDLFLTDIGTGYKVFRTEILQSLTLRADGFNFEPEITAKIAKLRCRVFEVPISYRGRSYSEGKKIHGYHALGWIWTILKYWLIDDLYGQRSDLQKNLKIMEGAGRYNEWLFLQCQPYVGNRVVEIGSGIGNITKFLVSRDLVVATDYDASYLTAIQQQFGDYTNVKIAKLDLTDAQDVTNIAKEKPDTVVALNVIEHIENDALAVQNIFKLLTPKGRFIMLVPAHQALYSPVDKLVGHHRRYAAAQVRALLEQAGFRVLQCSYRNWLGAIGWYVNGRILRRNRIPSHQLRLFDLFVPFLQYIDQWCPFPFGISVLAVVEKP